MFNGDRVSVSEDEKVPEMMVGRWLQDSVNRLNTAELRTHKWLRQ